MLSTYDNPYHSITTSFDSCLVLILNYFIHNDSWQYIGLLVSPISYNKRWNFISSIHTCQSSSTWSTLIGYMPTKYYFVVIPLHGVKICGVSIYGKHQMNQITLANDVSSQQSWKLVHNVSHSFSDVSTIAFLLLDTSYPQWLWGVHIFVQPFLN